VKKYQPESPINTSNGFLIEINIRYKYGKLFIDYYLTLGNYYSFASDDYSSKSKKKVKEINFFFIKTPLISKHENIVLIEIASFMIKPNRDNPLSHCNPKVIWLSGFQVVIR